LVVWGGRAEWDSDVSLGVAGIVLSVAGFSIAIQQIRTTRTASLAASAAVGHALKNVATVRASGLLPRLRQELETFESAIQRRDDDAVRRTLSAWRSSGLEAVNAFAGQVGGDHTAIKQLEQALGAAREAKAALYRSDDAYELALSAAEEMEKACDQLTVASNELLPQGTDNG
jgi:hypothetical protein